MNKMLVVVFDTEAGAEAGTRALRHLDSEGDITLYALGVIAKDADGRVSVRKATDSFGIGAGTGLAVGGLIGLLGGPVGVVAGAAAGTLLGTLRDFWVAGVGLGFIEEASSFLKPGKTAVVAEVEEEWVIPVDSAMEAAGGMVIRRARTDVLQDEFDRDIAATETEITQLEAAFRQASGAVQSRLQARIDTMEADLSRTSLRAKRKLVDLQRETEGRIQNVEAQVAKAQGQALAQLEARLARVRSACVERTDKLSQAWGLAKEALKV